MPTRRLAPYATSGAARRTRFGVVFRVQTHYQEETVGPLMCTDTVPLFQFSICSLYTQCTADELAVCYWRMPLCVTGRRQFLLNPHLTKRARAAAKEATCYDSNEIRAPVHTLVSFLGFSDALALVQMGLFSSIYFVNKSQRSTHLVICFPLARCLAVTCNFEPIVIHSGPMPSKADLRKQ